MGDEIKDPQFEFPHASDKARGFGVYGHLVHSPWQDKGSEGSAAGSGFMEKIRNLLAGRRIN